MASPAAACKRAWHANRSSTGACAFPSSPVSSGREGAETWELTWWPAGVASDAVAAGGTGPTTIASVDAAQG